MRFDHASDGFTIHAQRSASHQFTFGGVKSLQGHPGGSGGARSGSTERCYAARVRSRRQPVQPSSAVSAESTM